VSYFLIASSFFASSFYSIRYTNIDLKNDVDGKAIRAELGDIIGRTSVPAIWIKQQYIGGCNDGGPTNGGIVALLNNGQLDAMLQQAGAM
jgi:glutaredoxin 3